MQEEKNHVRTSLERKEGRKEGSHQESQKILKNLIFCIILIPCTLASKKKPNFAHIERGFKNFKLSPWWPPKQVEHLNRLLWEISPRAENDPYQIAFFKVLRQFFSQQSSCVNCSNCLCNLIIPPGGSHNFSF